MAVDASAVASVLGIGTTYQDFRGGRVIYLPQQIGIFAQGATANTYSMDPWQATSASAAGARYGFGSPIHLICLELLPPNGDGVNTIPVWIYPMEDHVSGVASVGDVTPSGTATQTYNSYYVRVGNIRSEPFSIPSGAITVADVVASMVAAVNAVPKMPFIASDNTTDMVLTAKWKGVSGDDIKVEVVDADGESPSLGVSFAFTQPTSGANNPDVDTPLAKVGSKWVTMGLNAMEITDTSTLDKFKTWGDGRWGETVYKPAVIFTGVNAASVSTATTTSSGRRTDRVNSQLVAPDSRSIPFVIAARQLARIAKVANNNPPVSYGGQLIDTVAAGSEANQWDYTKRDQAIKAGSSTVEVDDGTIRIGDVVTFYRPEGESPPAYRFVVNIVKLQNVIFNIALEFAKVEWKSAPLIPDDQPTVNSAARKPKSAKAAAAAIVENLGLEAILSNPSVAKSALTAVIDSGNPDRLNISMPVQVSGNARIRDVDLKWGFFFGQQALAA